MENDDNSQVDEYESQHDEAQYLEHGPNRSENQNINEQQDEKDDLLRKTVVRYNDNSYLSYVLRSNLFFSLGYKMDSFRKVELKSSLNLDYETLGLAVGLKIGEMISHGDQIIGIVRPIVKVHLVSIETGQYIKSKKLPPAPAVTTKPCALKDSTVQPSWHQELVIDAFYRDVASADSLLLFEILDDKPSFNAPRTPDNPSVVPTAKRIAWAYLLPIGIDGELNVGLSDDWKTSKRMVKNKQSVNNLASQMHDPNDTTNSPRKKTTDHNEHSGDSRDRRQKLSSPSRDSLDRETRDREQLFPADEVRNSLGNAERRNYPWGKRSADMPVRLQLHYYREHDGLFGFLQRKIMGWPTLGNYTDSDASAYPNGIPEVYMQWRLQRHVLVKEAYLSLALGPRPGELMSPAAVTAMLGSSLASPSHDSQAMLDAEELSLMANYGMRRNRHRAAQNNKSKAELARIRAAVLKRTRGAREPCVVPDKLLCRLDVGPEGAMVVAFSHSGHLLMVASRAPAASVPLSTRAVVYSLKLFDTDTQEEVWCEDAAHHGVVYEAKWTKDDRYLLTCSGDGTCKVWDLLSLLFRTSQLQQPASNVNNSMSGFNSPVPHTLAESNNSLQGMVSGRNSPPYLLHTLSSSSAVFVYSAVFQETLSSATVNVAASISAMHLATSVEKLADVERAEVPRIITGSSDGRLRVWDGGKLSGFVTIKDKTSSTLEGEGGAPHEGQVNALVIDERSKYMISADSVGDIFAWRCDTKGWYQLLRKFKREVMATTVQPKPVGGAMGAMPVGGVLSLMMHPDKTKGQLLALCKHPAQLKVFNMSTYKVQSQCAGFVGMSTTSAGGAFSRAILSADGRCVVSGSSIGMHSSQYRVQVWDSQTGHAVKTALSDYLFPYPIRSIAWHPKQHLFAVAMVGSDAAVALYVGDRDGTGKIAQRLDSAVAPQDAGALDRTMESMNYSILDDTLLRSSVPNKLALSAATLSSSVELSATDNKESSSENARLLKSQKAREMLSRLKASKAVNKESVDNN